MSLRTPYGVECALLLPPSSSAAAVGGSTARASFSWCDSAAGSPEIMRSRWFASMFRESWLSSDQRGASPWRGGDGVANGLPDDDVNI